MKHGETVLWVRFSRAGIKEKTKDARTVDNN